MTIRVRSCDQGAASVPNDVPIRPAPTAEELPRKLDALFSRALTTANAATGGSATIAQLSRTLRRNREAVALEPGLDRFVNDRLTSTALAHMIAGSRQAPRLLRRLLERRQREPWHFGTCAIDSLMLMADCAQRQRRHDLHVEVLLALRPCIDSAHGYRSPEHAAVLERLGDAYRDLGRLDHAQGAYALAADILGELARGRSAPH